MRVGWPVSVVCLVSYAEHSAKRLSLLPGPAQPRSVWVEGRPSHWPALRARSRDPVVLCMQANALVSGMAPLISTLRFKWHPLERPHRLPEESAFRAQRLCRQAQPAVAHAMPNPQAPPDDNRAGLLRRACPLLFAISIRHYKMRQPVVSPSRHCINVLSAFAASMDAHHIQSVHLLAQHRAQVGPGWPATACRPPASTRYRNKCLGKTEIT